MSHFGKMVPVVIGASCLVFAVLATARGSTAITLGDGSYVVPKGHVWKVSGLTPYESETGVGTADLYIDGQVQIGEDRGYTIYGKFDFSLGRKQRVPLWILEDSKVGVGDSRKTLTVQDFVDK